MTADIDLDIVRPQPPRAIEPRRYSIERTLNQRGFFAGAAKAARDLARQAKARGEDPKICEQRQTIAERIEEKLAAGQDADDEIAEWLKGGVVGNSQ